MYLIIFLFKAKGGKSSFGPSSQAKTDDFSIGGFQFKVSS